MQGSAQDLLLEIGTEELPPRFIPSAVDQMRALAQRRLESFRLSHGEVRAYGAPRRLAVFVASVGGVQDDLVKEVKGPPKRAAYSSDGQPQPAAMGFAASQGVDTGSLVIRDTPQGEYVFAVLREKGRPALEVLPGVLKDIVLSLSSPKSMRWGEGDVRFVRPIRWLAALYGREVVSFSLDGVRSDRYTLGHRLDPSGRVLVPVPAAYIQVLRDHRVIADLEERRALLLSEVRKAARQAGGEVALDAEVVEEVNNLVEYPVAICGSFDPGFLELPREMLITPMKGHQRYFPVEDEQGALMPRFVAVLNGQDQNLELIRAGNEKVLVARLKDAQFFFAEDVKKPLEAYTEGLKAVTFQESLGSLYDKLERLRWLCPKVGRAMGLPRSGTEVCERAAFLAKADLVTHMVYEFPELQGVAGSEYALRSGEPLEVARAIGEQYLPGFAGDRLPGSPEGTALAITDRMDNLAGCFRAGLAPSGSQDPYGLRRQALGVLAMLGEGRLDLELPWLVEQALEGYGSAGPGKEQAREQLVDFMVQRLRGILADRGQRHDLIEAVLKAGSDVVPDVTARLEALGGALETGQLEDLVVIFQRAANLAGKAPRCAIRAGLLTEPAEKRLHDAYLAALEATRSLVQDRLYTKALGELAALRSPVDAFFEEVLVMDKEEGLRMNRLALLQGIAALFEKIADLREIASPVR